jgi:hypothetical protein
MMGTNTHFEHDREVTQGVGLPSERSLNMSIADRGRAQSRYENAMRIGGLEKGG